MMDGYHPMLNVGAAYAPVEFALNSEVAHAAQIIPRPGIFMGRT
jgi:hypothetical protein